MCTKDISSSVIFIHITQYHTDDISLAIFSVGILILNFLSHHFTIGDFTNLDTLPAITEKTHDHTIRVCILSSASQLKNLFFIY
jgi:hypothetical protein